MFASCIRTPKGNTEGRWMGLFDYLVMATPCPVCGKKLEGQTKSAEDPCLETYKVGDLLPGASRLTSMRVIVFCGRQDDEGGRGCDTHWDVDWPLDEEGHIMEPPPAKAWKRWPPKY